MIFPFKITNINTNTEITKKRNRSLRNRNGKNLKKKKKMVDNESKSLKVSYGELVIKGELALIAR